MAKTKFDTSQSKLAKLMGVSTKAVLDARVTGKLPEGICYEQRGTRYFYNEELSRKHWLENSSPGYSNIGKIDLPKNATITAVKTAVARVDLQKKTIELSQLRGQLVETKVIYSDLFEFGQKVRQRIQAIPARVVDDLLAAKSRVDAMKILNDAISDSLSDLSDIEKFQP